MPAPTNIDFLNATLINTLPFSITQSAFDGGITYPLYFEYDAIVGDNELGMIQYGHIGGGGYRPALNIYYGDPNSPTFYGVSSTNRPVQINVVPGTRYFFEFLPSGNFNPSDLNIQLYRHTDIQAAAGSLLINDDTPNFPAVILSGVNGEDYNVLRFINVFPAGEQGDRLGIDTFSRYLFEDGANRNFNFYDDQFNLLSIIPSPWAGGTLKVRTCKGQNKFYIGTSNDGGQGKLNTVDSLGVLGSEILIASGFTSFALKNDGTIVYWTQLSGGDYRIRRYQIGTGFISDLAATVAGYQVSDMLVTGDDKIIGLYEKLGVDAKVIIYDSTGLVLGNYSLGTIGTNPGKIAFALDDPNSVWLWTHIGGGLSKFTNIKISNGLVLSTVNHVEYEGGVYEPGETSTPLANFGISFSCPFVVLGNDFPTTPIPPPTPPNVTSGIYKLVPGKRQDTLWNENFDGTTDVKIPNPTGRTGYVA